MFPLHIIAYVAPTHDLPSPPSTIFFILPGDDRLAPVSDLEAVGREGGSESRTSSITLYFSLQSWAARRWTYSLWDILDNSQCGKCVWIPNENRSSLCFIKCCYYQHFQIAHIPLTNRQPCRYLGGGKGRQRLDCHCSSATVHFLCNVCGLFFTKGSIYWKVEIYMLRFLTDVRMH